MIDMHSHIIPGVDDGSTDFDMTIEMLRNAVAEGTKKIVATPHYCEEYGETPIAEVKKIVEKLRSYSLSNNIDIEIYSGQEIYFCKNLLDLCEENVLGTINDSRYMLIELPLASFDEETMDVLYELQVKGIVPVLAHPERYREIIKKPTKINDFIEEGYLFQLNSGSIEGKFGESVRKTAELLVNNNIYSFCGSDAHNNSNRSTGIAKAIEIIEKKHNNIGNEFLINSNNVLNNEIVKFNGEKVKEKRGIFSFFR